MERALSVIDEAQIVATDLYGAGMTKRQQQQMMFEKKTVSVWDLANFEEKSLLSGEDVPWWVRYRLFLLKITDIILNWLD